MQKLQKMLPFIDSIGKSTAFLFVVFVIRRFEADRCREKAASLTYTTMLSIVPIITVMLVMLSSIPALENIKGQIQSVIYQNLLPQAGLQVSQYLNEFAEKSTNLTAIGALILFVTTIMMLAKIEDAFNSVWRVSNTNSRPFLGMTHYWMLITLGPIVLGVVFVASSAITSIGFLNQQFAGYRVDWQAWVQVVTFGLTIFGFSAIYWFIPNTRVPFKNALIAGAFTATLFDVLKSLFGKVMTNFTSYELVYGAFAALPVFLLWVYLSWCLVLLGVEISYAINVFLTREVKKRHPIFILLGVLYLLYEKQKTGGSASEAELKSELGREEVANWHEYKNILEAQELIAETDNNHYVLKHSLNNLSFWQFYQRLPYPLPHGEDIQLISDNSPWRHAFIEPLKQSDDFLAHVLASSLADTFDKKHTPDKDAT